MSDHDPKWTQGEMFRQEEYPSGDGVAKYQATRTAAELTPDEVRSIRRLAKTGQNLGPLARGLGISSRDCSNVAAMLDRAEVPADFETSIQQLQREMKHGENVVRKRREQEAKGKK